MSAITAKNSDLDISSILSLLKDRDSELISSLVHQYTDHLYRASLGMGFKPEQASDLVQNVWTTFVEIAPKFQGRSHVRTFIFGILYNKASELRHEQTKQNAMDPIDDVVESRFNHDGTWAKEVIDPERFTHIAQTRELIQKCIDALPLSQRAAFCLREIDAHETPEICKIMSVTTTHLGVLLFRARNKLRECIEKKANS